MRTSIFLLLFTFGCWGGNSDDFSPTFPPYNPPPDEPTYKPAPEPVLPITTTQNYRPDWYPYDPLVWVENEEISFYDSLFSYYKAIYDNWGETLTPGSKPEYYLENAKKAPEHITWIDETEGKIEGFEKLKAILPRIYERCPILKEDKFKLPLRVSWAKKDVPYNGVFFDSNPWLDVKNNGSIYYSPPGLSPRISIKGEFLRVDGSVVWQYPRQTHKEITGNEVWEEGGYQALTLDQTFAHEYGHFIFNAWAINSGKPGFGTYYFHEQFAELFLRFCYGGPPDLIGYMDNSRVKEIEEDLSKYEQPFKSQKDRLEKGAGSLFGVQYTLRAFRYLIQWEKYNNRYDPYKIFLSLIKTLENMKGHFPPQCPTLVRQERTTEMREITCPWEPDWKSEPETAAMKTLVFTRAELAEKFCNYYDCSEAAHIFESEAIGMRKNEW